jgi:hypothetical protein
MSTSKKVHAPVCDASPMSRDFRGVKEALADKRKKKNLPDYLGQARDIEETMQQHILQRLQKQQSPGFDDEFSNLKSVTRQETILRAERILTELVNEQEQMKKGEKLPMQENKYQLNSSRKSNFEVV